MRGKESAQVHPPRCARCSQTRSSFTRCFVRCVVQGVALLRPSSCAYSRPTTGFAHTLPPSAAPPIDTTAACLRGERNGAWRMAANQQERCRDHRSSSPNLLLPPSTPVSSRRLAPPPAAPAPSPRRRGRRLLSRPDVAQAKRRPHRHSRHHHLAAADPLVAPDGQQGRWQRREGSVPQPLQRDGEAGKAGLDGPVGGDDEGAP